MAIFKAHQQAWEESLPFPAPVLSNERSFSPTRPPLQPHHQSQGRPVPVVRFPSNNSQSPNLFQQQPHRMFSFPMQQQGSPPPTNMKMQMSAMDPRLDPRFSAAGLALPPPSPAQQTPPAHMRRISLQQSPQMFNPQQHNPPPPPPMQYGLQTPPSPFGVRQDNIGPNRDLYSPRRVPSSPVIIQSNKPASVPARSPSPSLSFDSAAASSSSSAEENRQPNPLHPAQRYVVGMPKEATPDSAWANLKKTKRRGGKRARKESLV